MSSLMARDVWFLISATLIILVLVIAVALLSAPGQILSP
jgi:hypothetical protein